MSENKDVDKTDSNLIDTKKGLAGETSGDPKNQVTANPDAKAPAKKKEAPKKDPKEKK